MDKSVSYDRVKSYINNKDKAVEKNIKYYLNKTQSMFKYFNLPDSIPYSEIEQILQENGHAFITEVDGTLYALTGNLGGERDEYGNATKIVVVNTALNLSKPYDLETDGVLIKNDTKMVGMLPMIYKYVGLLVDNNLTMNTISILSRISILLSAPDDKTKKSAEKYIKKILNGEMSIIGSNGFFEGIDVHNPDVDATSLVPLIEFNQYTKASLLNEMGLNANFNMKRERLTDEEVMLNDDALLPLIENMLQERRRGLLKVNDMFETDIKVELFSVWRNNREMVEKELSLTDKPDLEEMEDQDDQGDPDPDPENKEFVASEMIEMLTGDNENLLNGLKYERDRGGE